MSEQEEADSVRIGVVLVVPKKHVKTVKTALERHGQFDRTSKIIAETQENGHQDIAINPEASRQDNDTKNAVFPDPPQGPITSPVPGASSGDPEVKPQMPILKFDLASGEYVDPSTIEHRDQDGKGAGVAATPMPVLEFDPVSGEYVEPSILEQRKQRVTEVAATPPMPTLQFDLVTGEYVDPSVLEQRDQGGKGVQEQRMRVPTTIPYPLKEGETDRALRDQEVHALKSKILEDLVLDHLFQETSMSYQVMSTSSNTSATANPLHQALKAAFDALPEPVLLSLHLTTEALVSSFPDSYSVYKPMLLLPHNAFSSEHWNTLLSTYPVQSDILLSVWQRIAEAVGTTHVAVNSPIPLQTDKENILRSPVNLTPIYGDFGPTPTTQTLSSPTEDDFKSALWVTTTQNGIHQTWAPLYTMFSRGNIREKTRILNLPSYTMEFDIPSAAVDFYAGIGYFAFSYKKAGARRPNGIHTVLCWEMNPWSVEGLRRGADMNAWTCKVFVEKELPKHKVQRLKEDANAGKTDDFWVFQMSNDHALAIMQQLNSVVPPIRHVNLGLLPSSQLSWRSAVRILNRRCGGWIHAHENVSVKDIEARTSQVHTTFQRLVDDFEEEVEGNGKTVRRVIVEHVERVKTYAPGVVHVVFDVFVTGIGSGRL